MKSNSTLGTLHIKQNQWKKYGQKVINRPGQSPLTRCYFKCNYPGCEAKKQIEKELDADGNVVEINPNFWGIHCHDEGIFSNQVCYDEDKNKKPKSVGSPQVNGKHTSAADSADASTARTAGVVTSLTGSEKESTSEPDESSPEEPPSVAPTGRGSQNDLGNAISSGAVTTTDEVQIKTVTVLDPVAKGNHTGNQSVLHIKQNQWKKYGQKVVKRRGSGKLIRCYFRCNYPGCEAKKQIEKELDAEGNVIEINPNFWGTHCHDEGIFDNQVCYDEDESKQRATKSSGQMLPSKSISAAECGDTNVPHLMAPGIQSLSYAARLQPLQTMMITHQSLHQILGTQEDKKMSGLQGPAGVLGGQMQWNMQSQQ
jgi:hypothetical protein